LIEGKITVLKQQLYLLCSAVLNGKASSFIKQDYSTISTKNLSSKLIFAYLT